MGRDERQNPDRKLAQVIDASLRSRILDRFGRLITVGAQVVYKAPIDLAYTVTGVKPILDPRAQAGLQEITLLCEVTIPAMDRLPVDLIIVVAHPRVAADNAADNGNQQGDGATPPDPEKPRPTLVLPPGSYFEDAAHCEVCAPQEQRMERRRCAAHMDPPQLDDEP